MSWMVFVLGAALLVGGALMLTMISDLKWQLQNARHDAGFWEKEAKRMGWKNPFEELADQLRQSTELLKAAAERMSEANARQNESNERLRAMNRSLREGLDRQRSANAALRAATERLQSARSALPAPRVQAALPPHVPGPETKGPAVRAEDPLLREALRRVEAEAAAGRIETDPKKLN